MDKLICSIDKLPTQTQFTLKCPKRKQTLNFMSLLVIKHWNSDDPRSRVIPQRRLIISKCLMAAGPVTNVSGRRPPRAARAPLHYVIIPNAAAAPPGIYQGRTKPAEHIYFVQCFTHFRKVIKFHEVISPESFQCASCVHTNFGSSLLTIRDCRRGNSEACSAVSWGTHRGAGQNSECTPAPPGAADRTSAFN